MERLKRILFLWIQLWRTSKSLCFISLAHNSFKAIISIVNILGFSTIIDALVQNEPYNRIIVLTVSYLSIELIISILSELFQLLENRFLRKVSDVVQFKYSEDSVKIDYHYAQDGTLFDLRRKSMPANPAFYTQHLGGIFKFTIQFIGIFSIIAALNPLFLLSLVLISIFSIKMIFKLRKNDFEFNNEKVEDDRKLDYLYKIMTEYRFAKEIRINNAENYIANKYVDVFHNQISKLKGLFKKNTGLNTSIQVLNVIQIFITYIYFSYQVFSERISLAEYTALLSTTTLFISLLTGIFDKVALLNRSCESLTFYQDYNKFNELHSSIFNSNNYQKQKIDFSKFIIKFENVTFTYPNSSTPILKNINIEIKKGEKVGIVGLNGSGKTTLIKLLLRLYDPTDGRITINGVDIKEISHNEYIKHFGVVLQDFLLFAYSIKENIVLNNEFDITRFNESIKTAGFEEKLNTLPEGVNTYIYKTLSDNGIELSGGEGQKLAIARTFYKAAEILVLDEPTSTFDPNAEYEFFLKLNNFSNEKTSVFISHRLFSTKFCDKIIVLSHGTVAEQGNHRDLINKNGFYAELFNTQAKYYKKG